MRSQRIQPLPPSAPPAAAPPQSYAPPTQNTGYPSYPPAQSQAPPTTYPAQPPPANYPSYPPSQTNASAYRPPTQQSGYTAPPPQQGYGAGYGAPPPGVPVLPPQAQAQLATLPEDQRVRLSYSYITGMHSADEGWDQAMLLQVLSLSPDQVNALDPGQRQSIVQLVSGIRLSKQKVTDDKQRQQFLGVA